MTQTKRSNINIGNFAQINKQRNKGFLYPILSPIPVYTGRKLNVHKAFRRRPGRLLNVLCTFNLRPVSTGLASCCLQATKIQFLCLMQIGIYSAVCDHCCVQIWSNYEKLFWKVTLQNCIIISLSFSTVSQGRRMHRRSGIFSL